MKFSWNLWSNSNDCIARLGANIIKHASEMGLHIILATLEKFECWNQTLLVTKFHYVKRR